MSKAVVQMTARGVERSFRSKLIHKKESDRKDQKVIRLVVNYVLKFVREYYRFEHEMIMMLRGLEDKIKVGMNYE